MSEATFYGFIGGIIALLVSLVVLAVDLATRGPDRRAVKRRRKAYRAGIDDLAKRDRRREGPYR